MKLQDNDYDYYEEEHGSGSKMIYLYMALIMSAVALVVVGVIFAVNRSGSGSSSKSDGSGYAAALAQKEALDAQSVLQSDTSESKLTSDQLDIWTLPDTGRTSSSSSSSGNGTVTNQTTGSVVSGDSQEESSADDDKTTVYDMAERESMDDEKKADDKDKKEDEEDEEITEIEVSHSDGTKETVELIEDMERNAYDYEGLSYSKPIMSYSEDNKVVSTCGAVISSEQGDVDFSKLKKAGCSFVMIRIASRGYSSGNIVLDANYEENLAAAKKAGLDIGVYFCSQAVTKAEAREEADELLDAISGYNITYPIAFVMQNVTDDVARIEALDTDSRTTIAKAFMDYVESEGYTAALYGDLEWLLTMLDIERLADYDVWYAQDADEPDYPYEFQMWQYDSDATINGVDGEAALVMSFKDYS